MRETAKSKLVRELGLTDATMIVIGSMIGSGIFITSAESARLVGAPGWLLLAWILAGILTITGALCCAELAAMWPKAGGQYVFLRVAYGPMTGFLFGWSLLLIIQTGTIAAVAIAFANFTGIFFESISAQNYIIKPLRFGPYAVSLSTQQLLSIALIALLTVTNTTGLKTGKFIQNTFTFTKTAALIGLILVGLTIGWNSSSATYTSDWWNPSANGFKPPEDLSYTVLLLPLLLGRAMVGPLFAQSAWNNVTFTGEEIRDPGRNLPLALVLGCTVVVILYVLANLAYVVTLPLEAIQNAPQNRVATAVAEATLGVEGTLLMAAAIMISTFGCNNGLILSGARVYYAMSRDALFFKGISRTNDHHVPARALWLQGVWAALLTLPRTVTTDKTTGEIKLGNIYTQLLEYIIAADLVFYVLMIGAVIILRRKEPQTERPYRVPGYPVTPLIYILIALLLIVDLVYLAPMTSGVGFLLVLTGIPAYVMWRKHS
jgi:basic amino acid/polyamine antiporter, APA family